MASGCWTTPIAARLPAARSTLRLVLPDGSGKNVSSHSSPLAVEGVAPDLGAPVPIGQEFTVARNCLDGRRALST